MTRDSRQHGLPSMVRIGGADRSALLEALAARDVQLNEAAKTLFADARFRTEESPREIAIMARAVADLGFDGGTSYDQIVAHARERGLHECPLELGAHLRLQFLDQPEVPPGTPATKGRAPLGALTIASPPLDPTDETPKGFYLRHVDGVLWLRGYCSWSGHSWSPEDVFVFTREP